MSLTVDRLHQKLISVLIKWDEAEARRETKRGVRANIYRMGHLLEAAHKTEAEANANGGTVEAYRDAMMHNFTVTPRIHTFLKKNVDPKVQVRYGHWTLLP